jgi:hypothetical protein
MRRAIAFLSRLTDLSQAIQSTKLNILKNAKAGAATLSRLPSSVKPGGNLAINRYRSARPEAARAGRCRSGLSGRDHHHGHAVQKGRRGGKAPQRSARTRQRDRSRGHRSEALDASRLGILAGIVTTVVSAKHWSPRRIAGANRRGHHSANG